MKALEVSLLSAMIVDLDIRLASRGDARTLSVLSDANLGPGYFDLPEAGRTAVALDQGVIVGFCYAHAIKEDDPLWIGCCMDEGAAPQPEDQPLAVLQTIVVSGARRQCGIGDALVRETVGAFTGFTLVSPAWEHRDGRIPVKGVLERNGFVRRHRFQDYWKQDSIDRGYDCPDCGRPCRCSMVLFCRRRGVAGSGIKPMGLNDAF